jgi:hypothetical protein
MRLHIYTWPHISCKYLHVLCCHMSLCSFEVQNGVDEQMCIVEWNSRLKFIAFIRLYAII